MIYTRSVSLRFPVRLFNRVEAVGFCFPELTRSQIIFKLIESGLQDYEEKHLSKMLLDDFSDCIQF